MPGDLIRVLIIGHPDPEFARAVRLENVPAIWADGFDISCLDNDTRINETLARIKPQVIVTFGVMADFRELNVAPLDIRLRWIHASAVHVADDFELCIRTFLANGASGTMLKGNGP